MPLEGFSSVMVQLGSSHFHSSSHSKAEEEGGGIIWYIMFSQWRITTRVAAKTHIDIPSFCQTWLYIMFFHIQLDRAWWVVRLQTQITTIHPEVAWAALLFPWDAVTKYHKVKSLKQQGCILSQFWRLDVQNQDVSRTMLPWRW